MRTTDEAVTWIEAAEQCQQPALRLACVARLAQWLLAREPADDLGASIADAQQLERLDSATMALVLGLVTGAARQMATRKQPLAYRAPSDGSIATAIQQAANPADYEWRIELYSQQPAQPGDALRPPWFKAGGREWQLLVYPGGITQEDAGHLSGEQQCNTCTRAYCTWADSQNAIPHKPCAA